ncbi:TPA: peptide deformylase [candidate division CPR2 bacterium]|nr:peptide deformylase [candidate division CPR2 bacterium]HCL99485.1 peptide deformylase [candidate division CPR2 bacterium]
MVKNILQAGHPLLRIKSKEASKIDVKMTKLVDNMVNTLKAQNLVGLAAPQIGFSLRIIVTEIRKTEIREVEETDELRIFINPKIIWSSKKEIVDYEGCGSVAEANLFAPVKRPEKIKVKALDKNGKPFELKAEGLLSKVIQHEIDHLDGILFVDKIADTKQIMGREEYLKRVKKTKPGG